LHIETLFSKESLRRSSVSVSAGFIFLLAFEDSFAYTFACVAVRLLHDLFYYGVGVNDKQSKLYIGLRAVHRYMNSDIFLILQQQAVGIDLAIAPTVA
jgi:hypothetical protein